MSSNYNGIQVIKVPDATTKIITIDIVDDGLRDAEGNLQNVYLIVNGPELKGICFHENGEPVAYSNNVPVVFMMLRAHNDFAAVTVRHMAAGVDAVDRIKVTGGVGADAYLTSADSFAAWSYDETHGYLTRLDLWVAV